MSVSGFRWWDHKPLLRIPVLVVGSWGSWFLLLVSFWSTADWSDQNCKKHIIILFTHKSIHNSDRKGIKYRMFYPRWSTSLVVNKQFWSDQSAVDLLRCSKSATQVMLTCLSRILVFCGCNHLWRSGQLFFVHFLMSVSGFRWWDHKPLLHIPVLVVGSWGSWFLLLVSFWCSKSTEMSMI
jgi:uncharacterized YccA/Bax inhibitor family protein